MKNNDGSVCPLSKVPSLIERGSPKDLLCARAALLDAVEEIMDAAVTESRALKPEEKLAFDDHAAGIREINNRLADYKRQCIADCAGTGLSPVLPF